MAKEHFGDLVVDELLRRRRLVQDALRVQFKRTKPFRMVSLNEEQALKEYESIAPERMQELVGRYGEEDVGAMIQRMEELKAQKYGGLENG